MDFLAVILVAPAARVLVAGGSAGKLLHLGARVDRVVLPVPVSTDHRHVLLGGEEVAYFVSLVGEVLVGVVVVLAGAVGTDHGCRADEDAKGGV